MKLTNLKIGDKIQHYCSGSLITGEVITITRTTVTTKNEPINWGRDVYTETYIRESSQHQEHFIKTNH